MPVLKVEDLGLPVFTLPTKLPKPDLTDVAVNDPGVVVTFEQVTRCIVHRIPLNAQIAARSQLCVRKFVYQMHSTRNDNIFHFEKPAVFHLTVLNTLTMGRIPNLR